MPEPKFPKHPLAQGPTMRHDRIRAGSQKRSEAENDNPNVTDFPAQPDDPGQSNEPQDGPKHEAPDTAGARIAENVEREARRKDIQTAIAVGLSGAAGTSAFIGVIWLLVWLAG